ncbi:MAG: hypothetical protein LUG16_09055, partial [Candidatus Gastranaerophilales bacterium]|nr:hypothetical protein [Candidatus Gastranaerophilales bacterium]
LLYNMERHFSHIPNSQGWLCADEKKVEYFSKLDKFKSEKKKIGFFWRGNPNIMPNRSIDISFFSKIFEMKNMQFYSLDIVKKDEITKKIFEEYNITDCSEYIKNVDDTAAIIKNLDLVITIDSSIVHLAGALGVKTYLLLPNNPEWRWFKDDDKTIWYDSVKIFKQTKQGHWQSVIDRLKNQLLA